MTTTQLQKAYDYINVLGILCINSAIKKEPSHFAQKLDGVYLSCYNISSAMGTKHFKVKTRS